MFGQVTIMATIKQEACLRVGLEETRVLVSPMNSSLGQWANGRGSRLFGNVVSYPDLDLCYGLLLMGN